MTVENGTHIEASPHLVWAVTQDVERWPEWTPTVTSVVRTDEGPFRLGSKARIRQPMQPESEWVVKEFTSGRRFAWETRRAGLRMKGTHELFPEGLGTRSVLRVEASGPVALLLRPFLRPAIARALAEENRGLKRRCEENGEGFSNSRK